MADVDAYINQLESTIHRLEAKVALMADSPRLIVNSVPSCRATPNIRDLTPCVQIVTTRIDSAAPSPAAGTIQLDADSDEEGAPQIPSNRRRTTILAAVPHDSGSRRSVISHTSFDHFQSFLSGEFQQRESPSNKKSREPGSITFAVPNIPEPFTEHSLQDIHSSEPLANNQPPANSPSPPTGMGSMGPGSLGPDTVANPIAQLTEWGDVGGDKVDCSNEFVVVSEKEVEDKGTQCPIVMKASMGCQTVAITLTDDARSIQVPPTPPRAANDPFAHFVRHGVPADVPRPSISSSNAPLLPDSFSRPHVPSANSSLYEMRRTNRISSISSQTKSSI
ncbi:Hypothetical protein, putative [Bodo saltans]|uniref:Uncharacterized protein n=1 Tax=Bodo saltans TaxID=75058 RepID=A0A0S4IZK3_BODSA|nr:Hypothetical protein, putative [Bodo saltans]|eukprot:CUG04144.1 Hypothetical protein, putative [Bodo saltans]